MIKKVKAKNFLSWKDLEYDIASGVSLIEGYNWDDATPEGCHAKGQGILMHNGTVKKVEDIKVGEKLMGPDSKPRTVLRLCRGREQMYKVVPTKGETFVVNENHILSLRMSGSITREGYKKGEIIDISVEEYLKQSPRFKQDGMQYRSKSLNFSNPKTDFLINPYLMGIWLGDGHSHTFTVTTMDPEVKDEFISVVESKGGKITARHGKNGKATTYESSFGKAKGVGKGNAYGYGVNNGIKGLGKGGKTYANPFNAELYRLGVSSNKTKLKKSGNKHIPYKYLTSTRENRLALLAGLIDSDGHICYGGSIEIITKKEGVSRQYSLFVPKFGSSCLCI